MKSIAVFAILLVNSVLGIKEEFNTSCLESSFEKKLALAQKSPLADFSTCDRVNLIPSKRRNLEIDALEEGHVIITNLKANK